MNKYLLVGVVALLIIAGGWWYFSNSEAKNLKIGDKIGELTVSSIKDTATSNPDATVTEIKFTGTIVVTGTSVGVMRNGGQMILKKNDNPNLPRFVLETDRDEVYFTTGDNLPGDNERYVATVTDYTMYVPSDPTAWNTDSGHIVSFQKAQ